MMMIPRKRDDFDIIHDMFRDPFFTGEETKLMRTDIKEKEHEYIVDIDLPGYEKENIKIEIEDGYLTITAKKSSDEENKEDGKFVRKERFIGECSRSFYVGEDVREEEIKASFKNGTLRLEIPKKDEQEKIPEKKYIQIED